MFQSDEIKSKFSSAGSPPSWLKERYVDSLWFSDPRYLGQHRLTAWLVTYSASSSDLNQIRLVVDGTLRNKLQWTYNQYIMIFIKEIVFNKTVWKWWPFCQCVDWCLMSHSFAVELPIVAEDYGRLRKIPMPHKLVVRCWWFPFELWSLVDLGGYFIVIFHHQILIW